MNLVDIKNSDQNDWELKEVFVMELSHGLMGFFPVIEVETKKVVGSTNRDNLRKIWEELPTREVKVTSNNCLVNEKEKLMVPVSSPKGDDATTDDFLLITDNIEEYLGTGKLNYAKGLVSFVNESNATFPED